MTSNTNDPLDQYKNNPFTKEENQLLTSGVLGFMQTINLSWSLLRRDLARGFVIPWVLHFLLGIALMVIVFVSILVLVIMFFLLSGFTSGGLEEFNPGIFFFTLLTGVIIYVFLVIIFSFASFYITFKQQFILNHTEYESLLKTPGAGGFGKKILKAVAANLIVYTPINLISVALIFVGIGVVAFTFESENPLLIGFGAIVALLGFFGPLLNLIIAGFVWMYEQLIIQEDLGIMESLKTSYKIMKNYFWQNALRWFVFALVFFFPPIIVSLLQNVFTEIMPEDYYPIVIFLSLFGTLFNLIWGFVSWFFGTAFYYVSFYNIRRLYLETKEEV